MCQCQYNDAEECECRREAIRIIGNIALPTLGAVQYDSNAPHRGLISSILPIRGRPEDGWGMVIRLARTPSKILPQEIGGGDGGIFRQGGGPSFFDAWPGRCSAPLSTPLPRYHLLPAEKERRRSAMDAKTIIGIVMVLFIIGALVFLKIRSKK